MRKQVDFVWDSSITDLNAVRKLLQSEMKSLALPPYWAEWQIGSSRLPRHLRHCDRPAILVNTHVRIADVQQALAKGQLQYQIKDGLIKTHLFDYFRPLVAFMSSLLSLLSLLVPKCSLCWAVWMGVLSGAGIHIPFWPPLKWVLLTFAFINCLFVSFKGKLKHRVLPAVIMLSGIGLCFLHLVWENYLHIFKWPGLVLLAAGFFLTTFQRVNILPGFHFIIFKHLNFIHHGSTKRKD